MRRADGDQPFSSLTVRASVGAGPRRSRTPLDHHAMLTRKEIQKTKDDEELDDLVMIEAESRVSDPRDKDAYLKSIRALPIGLRAFWATWIVQCEVENGGIGQYFWNMRDEAFYEEARSGFRLIGAQEVLQLFEEALQIRNTYLPRTKSLKKWDDYVKIMGYVPLEENHADFPSRFLDALEKMRSIRVAFIRKNPQLFMEI